MPPRDQENQPQAPDLGASVQLESTETLEDTGDADALDAGYIPPDRPYGLDEDGVTGAGMREGDTLDERLRREEPEELPDDPDRAGRLVVADEGAALETPDALDGVDVGIDGGAASAEEAAVHEVADSDVGGLGAPVETEESVADAPSLADPELDAAQAADPAADRAERQAQRDLQELDDPGGATPGSPA
jgi:Family of unknown function (DUF5709)